MVIVYHIMVRSLPIHKPELAAHEPSVSFWCPDLEVVRRRRSNSSTGRGAAKEAITGQQLPDEILGQSWSALICIYKWSQESPFRTDSAMSASHRSSSSGVLL